MLRPRTGVRQTSELGRTAEDSRHPELKGPRKKEEPGAGFLWDALRDRVEQGKELSKDWVFAGDPLRLSPPGAQSMTCTRALPLEAKGLCDPCQSVIGQVCGGQGDL